MNVLRTAGVASACAIVMVIATCSESDAGLVINEVRYNVTPQGGNQYVELYNNGATNEHLDGKILTDEAGSGSEGVFQFPGSPGGTNFPVAPGAFVLVAVDATGATTAADWECYAGATDTDNPAVSNLTLVTGLFDLGLYIGGDNVLLADGTDTTPPIQASTVLDGVNLAGGNGQWTPLSPSATDADPTLATGTNSSACRCPDGLDNNVSSVADFSASTPTPGAPNSCTLPTLTILATSVLEGNSGSVTASFTVALSATSAVAVTVQFAASNGTAIAGSDYTATNGTLTFSPGGTSQVVRVSVLGDVTDEGDETFSVLLVNPTGATLFVSSAIGTILNDDAAPAITTSAFTRIVYSNAAVETVWSATSGTVYQLQTAGSILDPAWTNLGGAVTASSASATAADTNAIMTSRFYRVVQYY